MWWKRIQNSKGWNVFDSNASNLYYGCLFLNNPSIGYMKIRKHALPTFCYKYITLFYTTLFARIDYMENIHYFWEVGVWVGGLRKDYLI